MENKNAERVTPALITELKENEIFVFGSNIHGMHGGGDNGGNNGGGGDNNGGVSND